MRASLPLAALLLLLASAGALGRVPARHMALPSSRPGGPVALAPAQRQLLQLVTAVGVAAADGGNDDESAVAAVPAPEAEASGQACYDMRVNFGAACQVGIDRVAQYFPRGSSDPPTEEQIEEALQALKAGFLPSKGCCTALAPSFAAHCGCNPAFLAIRAAMQDTNPAFTPAYLQGLPWLAACQTPPAPDARHCPWPVCQHLVNCTPMELDRNAKRHIQPSQALQRAGYVISFSSRRESASWCSRLRLNRLHTPAHSQMGAASSVQAGLGNGRVLVHHAAPPVCWHSCPAHWASACGPHVHATKVMS